MLSTVTRQLGVVTVVMLVTIFAIYSGMTAMEQRHNYQRRKAMLLSSIRNDNEHFWEDIVELLSIQSHNCSEFPDIRDHLPEDFSDKFREYKDKLTLMNLTTGGCVAKASKALHHTYLKISQAPFIKTICETGFRAGLGSFTYLLVNKNIKIYSFDIGAHDTARMMADYLQELYPGRIHVTWGDSTVTVPEFHAKHPDVKCDLIHVSGGNTDPVVKADLENLKHMANTNNVVFLDYYLPRRRLWNKFVDQGLLKEAFHCSRENSTNFSFGIAIGKYV